jgi:hypothetical protein
VAKKALLFYVNMPGSRNTTLKFPSLAYEVIVRTPELPYWVKQEEMSGGPVPEGEGFKENIFSRSVADQHDTFWTLV